MSSPSSTSSSSSASDSGLTPRPPAINPNCANEGRARQVNLRKTQTDVVRMLRTQYIMSKFGVDRTAPRTRREAGHPYTRVPGPSPEDGSRNAFKIAQAYQGPIESSVGILLSNENLTPSVNFSTLLDESVSASIPSAVSNRNTIVIDIDASDLGLSCS